MGVYFRFYNNSRGIWNKIELTKDTGIYWYAKFHNLDSNAMASVFQHVANLNNWPKTDQLSAHADETGYASYIYLNGNVTMEYNDEYDCDEYDEYDEYVDEEDE